ncbi:MAG: DUF763 domain-containing protein [Candidatus Bilamarchaeaceae archaeon]
MKTGSMELPLHIGKCPPWLFAKMKVLAGSISEIIIEEYGSREFLFRLSNPLFFQAFGCALGFDWHSSGLTTTVCGALKEGINANIGIAVCGGKGKTSRKTPDEILKKSERLGISSKETEALIKATRLSAKVDNNCIQDGYQLYHHLFLFDELGNWAVIQQGMNGLRGYARRYHWFNTKNFVEAPQNEIIGFKEDEVLNLVSRNSENTRKASVDLVRDNPIRLQKYLNGQSTLFGNFRMPQRHEILECDLTKRDWEMLHAAYEYQPQNYEELVALRGIGAKSLRALALLSKLIYGTEVDWKDPIKYSFAHGGKDGIPYPVEREIYDESIEFLRDAVTEARIEKREKLTALKRLEAVF